MINEDTPALPAGLRAELFLRRGGWFTDALPGSGPEPADANQLPDRYGDWARSVLEDEATAEPMRTAGLGALSGPGSATPKGMAALLAAVFSHRDGWDGSPVAPAVAFAGGRGVPFLTRTAMLLAGVNTVAAGDAYRIADRDEAWRRWVPECVLRLAGEVRNRLATVPAEEYTAAEAVAATLRDAGGPWQWQISSLLFPDRQDWVRQDVDRADELPAAVWLLASVGDAGQLDSLADHPPGLDGPSPAMVVEGIGPRALPTLLSWLDAESEKRAEWAAFSYGSGNVETCDAKRRRLTGAIALIPTDEAFAALITRAGDPVLLPALRAAADRFPRRALRLLPATGPWPVSDLLRSHVARHPQAALAALPEVPAATAALIQAMSVPDAPEDRLHPVLISPPWLTDRRPAPPVVIPGLVAQVADEVCWAPGEQERFAASDDERFRPGRVLEADPRELLARVRTGRVDGGEDLDLVAYGPQEMVRSMLAEWDPHWWGPHEWLPPIVARRGELMAPVVLRVARRSPTDVMLVLMPLVSADIAVQMAGWFTRGKTRRAPARAWLLRHPGAAARVLIPLALDKPGKDRYAAESALRLLDRATVITAARDYSEQAAEAIASMLDVDPLAARPARVPSVDWADPETLPRIALRDGSGALPATSARHLATMLAMSPSGEAHPGVTVARDLLDPGELAEFGWALFRRWQQAGSPPGDAWALTALGHLGDDETVRRLTPEIRAWPGHNGHSKAVAGLDVLMAIGTDVALMHLNGIAQRVKFKGLKERAEQKMTELADAQGLTAEQLADRLVPDLGLSADGTLRLDGFVVGFDATLTPYVTDENGKRRKTLGDERFIALKKDVRAIARDQITRLERAMIDGRRWPAADFRQFLAGHPLLGHLVRRLLWAAHDRDHGMRLFRVTEDRTYADLAGTTLTVPDHAMIGLPHPAGADLSGWDNVFTTCGIVQPFPQLDREVFRPTGAVWKAFDGVVVPTSRVLGLEARGWRREEPFMGGFQGWVERQWGDRIRVGMAVDPGFRIGAAAEHAEQTLSEPVLLDGDEGGSLADLDPVMASELMLDLRTLTADL